MSAEDWTIVGIVTAGVGTIIGGVVKLVGSRAERDRADLDTADLALRIADRADEATARHKHALGTCEEQLRAMRDVQAEDRARIARLERAHRDLADLHALCPSRIALLESEQRIARQMLADLMRGNQSTPPRGIHPDELRAAQAAEETRP